jgi:hypothetical protein
MAISALIIRTIQEGEVAIVLVGLILLIDIIGLLLSFTQFSLIPIIAYIFLVVWDIQIYSVFANTYYSLYIPSGLGYTNLGFI